MKKSVYCEKCHKQMKPTNLIYSAIYHGYICLDCYHNQFPKIPAHEKPLLLGGYNQPTEFLASPD
jgi:hypothetical protein